jgi:hypothetical protein
VVKRKKSEDWSLVITRVDNGYKLEGARWNTGKRSTMVIHDDEEDELASHEGLLWHVSDYFNFQGSRHDADRIRIIREPGDKNVHYKSKGKKK